VDRGEGDLAGTGGGRCFIAVHVEIDAKYDVYLKRQTADVEAFRRDEGLDPDRRRLCGCAGLSNEHG